MQISNYSLLGIRINPLSIPDLHCLIARSINTSQQCIIASQNLHSIYLYNNDAKMQRFSVRAQYMRIDGMPIILAGRLLGYPLTRKHRVTYMDWINPLIAEADKQNWRIFYLGSKPDVVKRGANILKQQFPNLEIMTCGGYFDRKIGSQDNEEVINRINSFKPNILMVGMGMPRQEHWILDNLDSLNADVILTCGACMDYIAGAIPIPPRWMGKIGLEWLYRLQSEPKRLWRRYLLEPWFVFKLLLQDIFNFYILNRKPLSSDRN